MKDFFVRIDGPSQVALFAYDNATFVVESFLPTPSETKVAVQGSYTKLRNLVTGEVIASYVPEEPKTFFRRRRHADAPPVSHFIVPLLPHSFAAFAAEK